MPVVVILLDDRFDDKSGDKTRLLLPHDSNDSFCVVTAVTPGSFVTSTCESLVMQLRLSVLLDSYVVTLDSEFNRL